MCKKDMHGMLLLDKPSGISSNNVLQKIKTMFCAKKAGYIGTLDPLATGLLPICFGASTILSDQLNNSKKCYYAVGKLGIVTSTYDVEGKILKSCKVNFSYSELLQALKKLQKQTVQVVPNYSAIKYKGQPLYKYARKKIFIPKIKRNIKIYKLHCIECSNNLIKLRITCSKGTYIRRIIHDLGKLLRCGAHVIFLRRLEVGPYKITNTKTINQLNFYVQKNFNTMQHTVLNNFLIPVQSLLFTFPEIICSDYHAMNFIKNKINIYNVGTLKMFRMTIQNNNAIFIVSRIDQTGKLISCKILNIK